MCEVNASTGYFAPNNCLTGSEKKDENSFWSSNRCVRLAFWD